MDREELVRTVRSRLAGRNLVYFGTRGEDAEGVADLPELAAVFSVVAPYRRRASVQSAALEDFSGIRVDLDAHDIDEDPGDHAVTSLRRALLRALSLDSVVFTYRPSTFLSAVCFARQDRCTYAGMFKDYQAAFEHKPWVETEVRALGVPSIRWTYIADEEQLHTLDLLAGGPLVLRRSRSSGGAGITLLEHPDELAALWPEQAETFASVAPFLAGGIPTNVSAVVWEDGITLHHPSVQLIGIPECTTRPFGYCGNDFGAFSDLPNEVVQEMERSTLTIGNWLHARGFRGAFGVDFLVVEGRALFMELNPRFQGVTHASCQLAAEAGESCVMLEHLAALVGVDAPTARPLSDQVVRDRPFAHVVLHRTNFGSERVDGERVADRIAEGGRVKRVDVVCGSQLSADPGATIARLTVTDRITEDGMALHANWGERITEALAAVEREEV